MTIAQRIREKRLAAGMNMTELANKVGVSTSAVSNWEAGNTTPRGDAFYNLARALRTDEAYLRDGVTTAPAGAAPKAEQGAGSSSVGLVDQILDQARANLARALGVSQDMIKLEMSVTVKR